MMNPEVAEITEPFGFVREEYEKARAAALGEEAPEPMNMAKDHLFKPAREFEELPRAAKPPLPPSLTEKFMSAFLDDAIKGRVRGSDLRRLLASILAMLEQEAVVDDEAEEGRKYWLDELREVALDPTRSASAEKFRELRALLS